MSAETFIAFAMFALVGSITPGPNTLMLAATGAAFGMKRGLPTLLGVVLGFSLMVGIVALGLGAVITASPALLNVMRVAGIAMLCWMSWKIATSPLPDASTEKPSGRPLGFLTAAGFQWVNAKAWLVAVSATSTYYMEGQSPAAQALVFTGVFFAASVIACFFWLSFGAAAGRLLRARPRLARGFNIAMGLLLLASIYLIIA